MERSDRGGLRWGESYWHSKNVTWPFATLTVRDNYLELNAFPFPFFSANFIFSPEDVSALRHYRAIISVGIQVEHFRRDYPPFIVFWSFCPARTLADAAAAGFLISN